MTRENILPAFSAFSQLFLISQRCHVMTIVLSIVNLTSHQIISLSHTLNTNSV